MESIKTIFKVGNGPSSSHTMALAIASKKFLSKNLFATHFIVYLYGSLSKTGKGHLSDVTIKNILGNCEVIFTDYTHEYHSNGMKFVAYKDEKIIDEWLVFSVGGGELRELNEERVKKIDHIYPHSTMGEVLKYTRKNNIRLIDYIKAFEHDDLFIYLDKIFNAMENCINRGLEKNDLLPGELNLPRRASSMYQKYIETKNKETLTYALTLATSEENASGGEVVTSPTCGASGVLPGVIFTEYLYSNIPKEKLLESIAIAGFICLLVRTNASISGAEVGCQGEVGVACSGASAALCYLNGGNDFYIEYAAEIALEHHLGMTCDPILGMVQIPCIERNALASLFAYSASNYALLTDGNHYVKLDSVIQVMHETGMDIHEKYRETSTGGLALRVRKDKK